MERHCPLIIPLVRADCARQAPPWSGSTGRTKEARLYEQTRQGLIDYCGGDPSFAQLSQIDGICRITLLIAQLDPADTEHDRRLVLLNDALARSYKALGAGPAAPKRRQTLAERLAEPTP
jgi:hypothetical protein